MSRTPLIVTCAFGTAQARRLQLGLQSLRGVGDYAGAVTVLTDLDPRALAAACPRATGPAIDIRRIAVPDELAARLCRYELARHVVAAAAHAPLLCVEAEIVFDRPVLPLLDAVSLASRICFPAEHASAMTSHAMGGHLLRAQGHAATGCGFGAAAFGVPDGASAAHLATLGRVADTARTLWTATPALFRQWIDQPVANCLHALAGRTLFDTETLAPFFRWATREEVPAHDGGARRGAVHFADARRAERMRLYFDRLTAPGGADRVAPDAAPSWKSARPVVKLPADLGRGMADVDTRLVYGAFDRRT